MKQVCIFKALRYAKTFEVRAQAASDHGSLFDFMVGYELSSQKQYEVAKETLEAIETIITPEHTRAKKGRNPIANTYLRVDVIHDISEEKKFAHAVGSSLKLVKK